MKKPAPTAPVFRLVLTLALVLLGFISTQVVLAQENQQQTQKTQREVSAPGQTSTLTPVLNESTLTAIPPRLGEDRSLKAKPGEKIQTSVRVRNGSSQAMTIKTLAQDFIVDVGGDTPVPVSDQTSNRWSLASWIILAPEIQELKPGEIAVVNVLIEVPGNALPGGHYAMVTHQPDVEKATTNFTLEYDSAASLQQRVGTLLYLMVEGPINEAAFIRELKFPKFAEFGPIPFSFLVDNQSDIHIRPQAGVEIYNLLGRKVDTIVIEPKNVFPFVTRSFESQWDRIWGFGPYTAKVIMSYGAGGQLAMAQTSFWLLPITLLLAILVVILVATTLIIVIRRHVLHRRSDDQAKLEMLQQKVQELEADKLKKFDN